jgi:alpha-glucosidase
MSSQAADTVWYHHTTIYQIYPRSFYDSNGDGIGDIQGIIQKLDYIHDLGFETIWCSPFFKSPQQDFGYDVADYKDIAPEYGTLRDAQQLIDEVHKRGMKMVFDMVMNHTSTESPWFKESSSSKNNPKADWYIWRDKPNNWKSMTGGSGWHYCKERNRYYWASFLPFQPDLNYRNPEVKKAMLDIVRFWLSKGVDGFRLDIFNVIYKDSGFTNNPFLLKAVPTETDPSGFFQRAKYTINLPESIEFAKELRAVCDEHGAKMLLGEVSGDRKTIRRFMGDEKNNGLGLVFNFEMLRFKFSASYFHNLIANIEKDFPAPFSPVYCFSNHDRRRSIKRLGDDVRKAKLLQLLQLTVRGTACMYYGEEIGMTDVRIPFKQALDPIPHKFSKVPRFLFDMTGETLNRDEVRTPMQWDNGANAGFSKATKTWLPLHAGYIKVNVQTEQRDTNSLLNLVKEVLKLRKQTEALNAGSMQLVETSSLPANVLGYIRDFNGQRALVLLNFSGKAKTVKLPGAFSKILLSVNPNDQVKEGEVLLSAFGGIILAP